MKSNKKHCGPSFEENLKERLKNPEFAELFEQEHIKYEIAEIVKRAREKAGFTQAQLAHLAGLHQAAIARIESRSSRMVPGLEVLRRIFIPLGYKVDLHLEKLKTAA
jgi:ribosome-binding protein aMBF1 (putative translation factor)